METNIISVLTAGNTWSDPSDLGLTCSLFSELFIESSIVSYIISYIVCYSVSVPNHTQTQCEHISNETPP